MDKSDVRIVQPHLMKAHVFAPESAHSTESEAKRKETTLYEPGIGII